MCATATITGIGEAEDDGQISISPNPTNGLVNIEGATVAEVLVYNALGQKIDTLSFDADAFKEATYIFPNWSNGWYYFVLQSDEMTMARKVTLER